MTRGLPAFTAGGVMRKRGPPAEFGAINLPAPLADSAMTAGASSQTARPGRSNPARGDDAWCPVSQVISGMARGAVHIATPKYLRHNSRSSAHSGKGGRDAQH